MYDDALQESGLVLKYQTKYGVTLTPIKMPSFDDNNTNAMKYLMYCKAIEYVCQQKAWTHSSAWLLHILDFRSCEI